MNVALACHVSTSPEDTVSADWKSVSAFQLIRSILLNTEYLVMKELNVARDS